MISLRWERWALCSLCSHEWRTDPINDPEPTACVACETPAESDEPPPSAETP